MQSAMDALTGFLERRRWLILGVWVALLLAAIPFAMRQTDNLTSGGFSAPGSGSEAVDRAIEDFGAAQSDSLALVVGQRPGAKEADVRAAIDRADRAAARLPHVEMSDRAKAAAYADIGRSPIAIAAFDVSGNMDQTADLATDLRKEVGAGDGPKDGVQTYLVGEQALWAGMQDLSKEDLAAAEATGFPIVLLILLAVFGSLAAAALPLILGVVSVLITGAIIFFLSQSLQMSVFVTNMASMIGIGVAVDYSLFILARYREEIRGGPRARGGSWHRHAHLRLGRGLLGHHGDRLAGRPLPGGLHHHPLDGTRRDRGGGRVAPRRGHVPAGDDAAVRTAGLHARTDHIACGRGRAAAAARAPQAGLHRARRRLLAALD